MHSMHGLKMNGNTLTWLGHASFLLECGKRVYIDPFILPEDAKPADIILITHDHFDHFDLEKINSLKTSRTSLFGPASVIKKAGFGIVLKPGDTVKSGSVSIEAVEAYNVDKNFHPKGLGIGFVVEMEGVHIYHSGDTDFIKEMREMKNIDIALLPIGGYYTMNVNEAAQAAKAIQAKVVVPMHYNSDKYGISGIKANPGEFKKLVPEAMILEPLV